MIQRFKKNDNNLEIQIILSFRKTPNRTNYEILRSTFNQFNITSNNIEKYFNILPHCHTIINFKEKEIRQPRKFRRNVKR